MWRDAKAAWPLLVAIFTQLPCAVVGVPCLAADKPNVILILADDLGYGDLGCYGQKQIRTPQIDRLAQEGMRFTQFYAGSTVCAPSRCSLMTGLHTGHTTIRGNATVPLRAEDVTVAEVFHSAGYATGLIGKWGLGLEDSTGAPNRQGFDYFLGYLDQVHAHDYYPAFLWRNDRKSPLPGNADGRRGQYTHDLFTFDALQFIERHKERPFFLFLAYTIPHANNERGVETGDGMEVPCYQPYQDKDWPSPQKGHAAMISRMDMDVGRIMDLVRKLDLEKNTLVLLSSDNGPHAEGGAREDFFDSNGPLRGKKRDLYEGGIRVPMIAHWPGRVPAGQTSDMVWAMWDVLPTMAELIGSNAPDKLDGISMLPTLLGKPQKGHDFLYWEFHEGGFSQAARMGEWKAVRRKRGKIELYNLNVDPGENHNVADAHVDVVAAIEARLETARSHSDQWPAK